jgi:hypothetical protein
VEGIEEEMDELPGALHDTEIDVNAVTQGGTTK